MLDAGDDPFPVTGKAVNAGAGTKEFLRHSTPRNAARADNQRYDFHACLPYLSAEEVFGGSAMGLSPSSPSPSFLGRSD
jgi:hypothetical protein